jgi:NAD(P)-dependent dehydrogenase (short-subunit alcohol dehydrogenase family)
MGVLEGKVAVISGGTSGIGAKSAELFVSHGAKVVIAGRRQETGQRLAEQLGQSAVFIRTDVSVEAEVKAMIELAVKHFGRLDCLFNNAGIPSQRGGIADLDLEAFDAAMAIHLRGTVAGTKHAVPVMAGQACGSIINTASINGMRAGLAGIDYCVAKAAVIHLTRCAAVELGEKGIRVNCISPGPVATGSLPKAPVSMATPPISPSARQKPPSPRSCRDGSPCRSLVPLTISPKLHCFSPAMQRA